MIRKILILIILFFIQLSCKEDTNNLKINLDYSKSKFYTSKFNKKSFRDKGLSYFTNNERNLITPANKRLSTIDFFKRKLISLPKIAGDVYSNVSLIKNKVLQNQNKKSEIQNKNDDYIYFKKIDNPRLILEKLYVMGALASLDLKGKCKRNANGEITYTYHVVGDLYNKSRTPIMPMDGIYLELTVYFREKIAITHIDKLKEKYYLTDLGDFDNKGRKIRLPINPGEVRSFEVKLNDIPESNYKIGLQVTLRDKEKIWARQRIVLHKPAPPPKKEKFFDFLKQPSSTKWWYLTLGIGCIALILGLAALV